MKSNFSRRRFLATAGATLVGKSLFDVSKVFATTPYVRPDVNGVNGPAALTSYANGITAMQGLAATDPRSWSYQAAIHGTTAMTLLQDWNTCQHGAVNFFLPWHRIYLYFFERIVRSQSGDSNWALPYWDWQANPFLPAQFQVGGNAALYVPAPNRNVSINNGSVGVGNQTPGVNNAFAQPIFETPISGPPGADLLIQYPHNNVHVAVGNWSPIVPYPYYQYGWMSNPQTAAQDPIFYLHHSNVDRLWNLWLAYSNLNSDPTADTAWGGMVFNFFDENANQVSMTPCDVLRALQQLNYSYEVEPTQVNQYCFNPQPCKASYTTLVDECIQKPPFYLPPSYGYGYYQFPISYGLGQQIYGYLKNPLNTIYLTHYGVTCPTNPGVVWDVYCGLPIGAKPGHGSPYYVGSYSMYGAGVADEPPDGNEPATFGFPVNQAILTALQKLKRGGNIPITFFPTSVPHTATGGPIQKATLTIQQAQLTLQTVTPTGRAAGIPKKESVVAKLMPHH
jgi:tyrosinase